MQVGRHVSICPTPPPDSGRVRVRPPKIQPNPTAGTASYVPIVHRKSNTTINYTAFCYTWVTCLSHGKVPHSSIVDCGTGAPPPCPKGVLTISLYHGRHEADIHPTNHTMEVQFDLNIFQLRLTSGFRSISPTFNLCLYSSTPTCTHVANTYIQPSIHIPPRLLWLACLHPDSCL